MPEFQILGKVIIATILTKGTEGYLTGAKATFGAFASLDTKGSYGVKRTLAGPEEEISYYVAHVRIVRFPDLAQSDLLDIRHKTDKLVLDRDKTDKPRKTDTVSGL
jgi:hypothetical protein